MIFAAPVLDEDVHLRELLANLLRLCARLVYLVDGEHHRDACRLCVVYGLDCLWHDRVIGCDDNNREVGQLGTTCTHGCEGLMSRGVEEGNPASVMEYHVVCTDVLCDTSGLTCDDIGLSDVVEEGCLTVVNVSHHCDDRRSCHEICLVFRILSVLVYLILDIRSHELDFVSELLCNKYKCLCVKSLVD